MSKIKDHIGNIKENFAQKTIRQKIRFCIMILLLLTFLFFLIKGNFFDVRESPTSETSQSSYSGESYEDSKEEQSTQSSNKVHFQINWIDIGVLAVLCTAYGVHKYREKKREKRL